MKLDIKKLRSDIEMEKRRIAVERAESEVIRTGTDLASLVIASPDGIDPQIRAQAQLFLRRKKRAWKLRLDFTIDHVTKTAKEVDEMVPDAPKPFYRLF